MNSFVILALLGALAGAQAGYLHQPVLYAAPVKIATPILKAEYPTYAVHSPHIGSLPYHSHVAYAAPIVKTFAAPVYHAPIAYSSYGAYGGTFFRK